MAHDLVTELLQYSSLACFMPIWQLCANMLIPNCLRSNLSYSPLAALELYVKLEKTPCDRELIEKILAILEKHEKLLPQFLSDKHKLYDNKTLMAKLGVREKYLKKLRDNGYLGYSREGDKYWYTQEDVDRFLRRFHYEAFAIGDELPKQEGGGYV